MIRTSIVAAPAPLPPFPFHWDEETEILSGRHDLPRAATGFTGSWEIESPTGAVLVLETTGGVLGGIEVVVWPDVERAALTVPHEAPPGRLVLEAPNGQTAGVLEVEAPIGAAATAAETLVRLTFGPQRARSVRIAANVVADLDAEGRLAGLWLEGLPLFQQGGMTAEPDRLAAYITGLFAREDAALAAVRSGHRAADLPAIHISPDEGAILHLLVRLSGARRVLELGTLSGYSGIWMARALPPGGRLVTIEGDERHAAHAREAFARAGLTDRVELIEGEALDTLAALEGPFDAIFLDADKAPLPAYLEASLRLLRVGGLLLCDNTFMDGRIADPDQDGSDLRGMREFNRLVSADPRLTSAVIPVRDGLLVALRVAP